VHDCQLKLILKNKKSKTFLQVGDLLVGVFLFSCDKEDDSSGESCENGTFTMTLNEVNVVTSSFNNTLLKSESAGKEGKRMDIRATDESGRQLIITFTDLSTGKNGNGVSTDEYVPFVEVVTGEENTFFFTFIEANGISYYVIDGIFDITGCNADAKTISGTFSFTGGDYELRRTGLP
jgi:hypothetical protein